MAGFRCLWLSCRKRKSQQNKNMSTLVNFTGGTLEAQLVEGATILVLRENEKNANLGADEEAFENATVTPNLEDLTFEVTLTIPGKLSVVEGGGVLLQPLPYLDDEDNP